MTTRNVERFIIMSTGFFTYSILNGTDSREKKSYRTLYSEEAAYSHNSDYEKKKLLHTKESITGGLYARPETGN